MPLQKSSLRLINKEQYSKHWNLKTRALYRGWSCQGWRAGDWPIITLSGVHMQTSMAELNFQWISLYFVMVKSEVCLRGLISPCHRCNGFACCWHFNKDPQFKDGRCWESIIMHSFTIFQCLRKLQKFKVAFNCASGIGRFSGWGKISYKRCHVQVANRYWI